MSPYRVPVTVTIEEPYLKKIWFNDSNSPIRKIWSIIRNEQSHVVNAFIFRQLIVGSLDPKFGVFWHLTKPSG